VDSRGNLATTRQYLGSFPEVGKQWRLLVVLSGPQACSGGTIRVKQGGENIVPSQLIKVLLPTLGEPKMATRMPLRMISPRLLNSSCREIDDRRFLTFARAVRDQKG
jgi:hypothetical protein